MRLYFLTALFLSVAPASVFASQSDTSLYPGTGEVRGGGGLPGMQSVPAEKPVQLAQNYDFDVYVDQQGREIIVDAYTGRVVEIRPPVEAPRQPVYRQRQEPRLREWNGEFYDFNDPQEVERYRRDRRSYGRQAPADTYQEPDWNDNRRATRQEPSYGGNGQVQRSPLPAPGGRNDMASVPRQEMNPDNGFDNGQTGSFQRVDPTRQPLPNESAVLAPTGATEEVARIQILLDRANASPGVIDGRMGDNVNKAIRAYREITGDTVKTYDKDWVEAELERTGGPAFQEYTITAQDAAGPFIASVPADYSHKAQLDALSYTSVTEMLAERFHMDEKYLIALNPGVNFNRAGSIIKVVNPGKKLAGQVGRIVADKANKQLRVYGEDGRLMAAYPATIGSSDTPSPSGSHTVARIALNPEYTYNPKINFKQGANDKVLRIPPGPNGPVGSVWIALSKPTYGIHGTPDPSKIGKTASHGCVRLTNWDAEELAKRVKPGVPVVFEE
ncbi:Lipoprotein-anchoring transpeptidase ErfK/SrfK [Nitratireductor indicus]|nr:L,D-transpeptidase [Nitratireductor indicus]SFQ76728.1 Lipoprotein-anchoring transpeptidase ErfK/SrfK [Nitratireductor indicus]